MASGSARRADRGVRAVASAFARARRDRVGEQVGRASRRCLSGLGVRGMGR